MVRVIAKRPERLSKWMERVVRLPSGHCKRARSAARDARAVHRVCRTLRRHERPTAGGAIAHAARRADPRDAAEGRHRAR